MRIKTLVAAFAAVLIASLPMKKAEAQVKFMDYKSVTMADVLKKAQAENKNIFVDIWTPWCGVCKMMDRWIFPRKDVGEYFNNNFINLTFDAENPKWVAIAKSYNATAFPTMLILNPKGKVILNIDNLGIPQASDASGATSPVGARLMYQAGMAQKLITMPDTAFLNKETVTALSRLKPAFDTQVFQRIITLKAAFLKQYSKEFYNIVDEALGSAAVNMVSKTGHAVNTHKAEQYRSVVEALNLPQKQSQLLLLDLNIALATRQWKQALSLVEKQKTAITPLLYATLMDGLSEGCQDKAVLRSALKLCSASVSSAPAGSRLGNYLKQTYETLQKAAR